LGLVEHPDLAETTVDLRPGDAFVLYTDGLFGPEKANQPRLTPTQLAGMLNPFATDAETLLSRMLDQAGQNSVANTSLDDVAVLAVRRTT
jgi:serine phosphatase RsbU (regulator of sigma subunit)